jgi:hypothetical protein
VWLLELSQKAPFIENSQQIAYYIGIRYVDEAGKVTIKAFITMKARTHRGG